MVNTVRVYADHGRDFQPLADHMTKLRNFTKGEIRKFSTFSFSFHLIFHQRLTMDDQTFSNVIVYLMISQKSYTQKLHKRASMLLCILSRFNFSQN